jgi:hypothetical protein
MIKGWSHFSVSDFVDVVVEQFIDEVHMGQEHPSAAIPVEAQLIQDLANVDSLQRLSVLIPLSDQQAELFPFVSDNLAAAEATHGDDHLLISINYKEIYLLRFQIHKVHKISKPMNHVEHPIPQNERNPSLSWFSYIIFE